MSLWNLTDLCVSQGGVNLLRRASLTVNTGELVALIGPNGAGKTTLIRAGLGLVETENGTSTLGANPIADLSPAERAKRVSYLPQSRPLAWPIRVRDVVALGRFAHGSPVSKLTPSDAEAVETALRDCDLLELADRPADTLSGGELARVHCARAFASGAPLLIADEPVAALDPFHQFAILELIARYVASGGGALIVLHDLTLAARFASRVVWMQAGKIVADGTPEETMTAPRLAEVFGIHARLEDKTVLISGRL